ncbi:MAG: DUF4097 family beta strand repeat-containing protein [Clostridia bacterium]
MKKHQLIACIAMALGLILAIAGFAMAEFDLNKLDTQGPYTTQAHTFSAQDVGAIRVSNGDANISILPSSDESVHVSVTFGRDERYQVGVDAERVLAIEYVSEYKWFERLVQLSFGLADAGVKVYVPKGLMVPIALSNSTGKIAASDVSATALTLHNATGDVRVDNVAAESIDVTTSTGTLSLEQLSADRLAATTATGRIDLRQARVRELRATAGTGSVALEGVDAQDIVLSADTGNISGTLAGAQADYAIQARTGTGFSSLPQERAGGPRKLNAKTGTGAINVKFEQ